MEKWRSVWLQICGCGCVRLISVFLFTPLRKITFKMGTTEVEGGRFDAHRCENTMVVPPLRNLSIPGQKKLSCGSPRVPTGGVTGPTKLAQESHTLSPCKTTQLKQSHCPDTSVHLGHHIFTTYAHSQMNERTQIDLVCCSHWRTHNQILDRILLFLSLRITFLPTNLRARGELKEGTVLEYSSFCNFECSSSNCFP